MESGDWRLDSLKEPFNRAERLGAEYRDHRSQIMLSREIGLTKTYNLFHDPGCADINIKQLRKLHVEIDRTILACYGWEDLNPDHGFYQMEREEQTRFTFSSEAQTELRKRLLELNAEIAQGGVEE
jgi:hypothetical protein